MSLLDFLNTDDGRLGVGLLAAAGPSSLGFGERIQQAMNGQEAYKTNQMRNLLLKSQVAENDSQSALRVAQADQKANLSAYMKKIGLLGDDGQFTQVSPGAFAPAADGYGPTMPASVAPTRSGLSNLSIDQVATLKTLGGPDLLDAYKWAKDGTKREGGSTYIDNVTGEEKYYAKLPDGMTRGRNGAVAPEAGYPEALALTTGAQEDAKAAAQAKYDLVPVRLPNGSMGVAPRASVLSQFANPAPAAPVAPAPASPMTVPPQLQRERDMESVRMIQAELQNPNLPPDQRAGLQREVQRIQGAQTQPGFPTPSIGALPPRAPTVGVQTGPSPAEAAAAEFQKKSATDQAEILTKSYGAANDAATALAGIAESRKAVQGGAYQGAGADFKLEFSKFAQGMLGIKIDPEKVGNTDYLKSTLGNGLLEKAKTLGSNPSNADASRITDIVGSIGKDPQAMAKILDWQEQMARKAIDQHNTKVDQASGNGFSPAFDMHVKAPELKARPADRFKTPPTMEDIRNTALKHGMTVEQVKQKLGL